jgi:hypothetical protein
VPQVGAPRNPLCAGYLQHFQRLSRPMDSSPPAPAILFFNLGLFGSSLQPAAMGFACCLSERSRRRTLRRRGDGFARHRRAEAFSALRYACWWAKRYWPNNVAEVQQLAIRRDGLPIVIRTRFLARNREQIRRLPEPGFKPRVGLMLGGDL